MLHGDGASWGYLGVYTFYCNSSNISSSSFSSWKWWTGNSKNLSSIECTGDVRNLLWWVARQYVNLYFDSSSSVSNCTIHLYAKCLSGAWSWYTHNDHHMYSGYSIHLWILSESSFQVYLCVMCVHSTPFPGAHVPKICAEPTKRCALKILY